MYGKKTFQISVDGGWGEWSEWSGTCDIDCAVLNQRILATVDENEAEKTDLIPRRTRYRLCDRPEPANGGKPCVGAQQEFQQCNVQCAVDGRKLWVLVQFATWC